MLACLKVGQGMDIMGDKLTPVALVVRREYTDEPDSRTTPARLEQAILIPDIDDRSTGKRQTRISLVRRIREPAYSTLVQREIGKIVGNVELRTRIRQNGALVGGAFFFRQ